MPEKKIREIKIFSQKNKIGGKKIREIKILSQINKIGGKTREIKILPERL